LTIVQEQPADHFRVLANVKTQPSAKTMALDPKTHKIYLAAARFKAPEEGKKRGAMEKDSFEILVVGK
jgi:hypothetical protein